MTCWLYVLEAITELLVDHGAYPEARNRRNATPMMLVSDGKIARILTKAIEAAQEKANDGFVEVMSVSFLRLFEFFTVEKPSLSYNAYVRND